MRISELAKTINCISTTFVARGVSKFCNKMLKVKMCTLITTPEISNGTQMWKAPTPKALAWVDQCLQTLDVINGMTIVIVGKNHFMDRSR